LPELSVATFNLHAGVDGWGRRYDVVSSCARLDADVLVLQETWNPAGGEGLAAEVAAALGYQVHEVPLSDAILLEEVKAPGTRWGPHRGDPLHARRLWVADSEDLSRLRRRRWGSRAQSGSWGIAVLTRLPVRRVEVIELGRLRRDRSMRRAAILVEVDVGSYPVTVVGTHLAHFTHGSASHLQRLRRRLPAPRERGVLAGDMNFWGPPLSLALPGWRRAVRARTYPSWHAHSQVDHIFVTRAVEVLSGEMLQVGDSDHRPIRARLGIC